ncbi:MAG: DUF6359 domain-containing protein [Bacteroidales bacterium]|nr:DUF6359 domain-containing protein [Bacteroidales bacterium]
MKRTLLFFVSLFVMTLSAMAGDVVLSWSSAADWQTDADKNISFTKDGYTLSLVKVSGNSVPVVNAKSNDARLYSVGTFTLSSTNGNMTKVVIKVSSSGAKRLAEYAASTGTAVVDKNALTVTWTGDAAEFTLTVEGKAVNGTEPDKAAQLCFDNVTIVDASAGGDQGGGDQGGGNEPTEELQNVFTESFAAGKGDFTIEDKVRPEALNYVWTHNNNNNGTYMKASAYKKPTAYAAESWLVSPVIDLSNATACQLSVQQAANYFKNQDNVLAALSVKVKEAGAADWTDLTLSAWPAGTNWTFVEGTADLAAYDGKQIQVAFVYTSTAELAGTYEVKDFAVRGKTDTPEPEPEVTTYNSLSELAGAATTAATPFVLNLNNVVVAGVGQRGSNYSIYLQQNEASALIYTSVAPSYNAGNVLSGKLSGNLVLYNHLAEITDPNYEAVTVSSQAGEISKKETTIATLKNDASFANQSRYVTLKSVYFKSDKATSENYTLIDDSDNEITLRDNFSVMGDLVIDTEKPYTVSGFVAYYNDEAQLYPISAADISMETNLISADTKWAQDEVAVLPGEDFAGNNLTTLTDGARTFTSSNTAVATVDSEGKVTIVGKGVTTITVETAETATYLASRASYKLFVIEGKGTLAEPYTVADVQYYINQNLTERVWVKGTIFGSRNNNVNYPAGDENVVASNIVIGSEELFVPVQLSTNSEPRAALNLVDNPSLQGKDVWVYGNLETYFSMPGVKNVTDYSLDGATGISSIEAAAQGKAAVIYSIDGRRLMAPVKGVQIINGRKVIR